MRKILLGLLLFICSTVYGSSVTTSINSTTYTSIPENAGGGFTVTPFQPAQCVFSSSLPTISVTGHRLSQGDTWAINSTGVSLWCKNDTTVTGSNFITTTIAADASINGSGVTGGGGGGGNVNLNQVGGASFALGQSTMSGSLPVTIASNQSNLNVNCVSGCSGGGSGGSSIQGFILTDDNLALFVSRDDGATPPVFSYYLLQDGSVYTPSGTIRGAIQNTYPVNSDGSQLFFTGSGSSTHATRVILTGSSVTITPQGFFYADASGTITTGGTAQELSTSGNTLTKIQNIDVAEDLWVNDSGGTAAISTPGSFKIIAGAVYETDSNAQISVIAVTTGHPFTVTYK